MDTIAMSPFNIAAMDARRLALKCSVCLTKGTGACIQCAYTKCHVAVHPRCALISNASAGFSSRILEDAYDELGHCIRQVFCPKHRNAATLETEGFSTVPKDKRYNITSVRI